MMQLLLCLPLEPKEPRLILGFQSLWSDLLLRSELAKPRLAPIQWLNNQLACEEEIKTGCRMPVRHGHNLCLSGRALWEDATVQNSPKDINTHPSRAKSFSVLTSKTGWLLWCKAIVDAWLDLLKLSYWFSPFYPRWVLMPAQPLMCWRWKMRLT